MNIKNIQYKFRDRDSVSIKVTNHVCGRVDIHRGITYDDLLWIICNPNLSVEFLGDS